MDDTKRVDQCLLGGDLLLTIDDVCYIAGLGRTAVKALISSGDLPSVKIGGARRVPLSDLNQFVEGLRRDEQAGRREA